MPVTLSARDILDRLVAFPSVSRDTNLPLIDWVQAYLESHGIACWRVPAPCKTKAHLYAHAGPWVPGGVVLSGHSDVVPVDGQDWSTDPWCVTERDGKLYGRGTCDMKGFVALAIAALVQAQGRALARPVQLALSYDEEVGCMAVADLVDAMVGGDLPRAGAVIVGEPSMMQVVTGHKGGIGFWVDMRGFEVHSSLQPYGVSAIMEGARIIDWLNCFNAREAARVPGPLAAPFDPPFSTVNVGMISGGTAHNITARDCRFAVGFRVTPGDDVGAIEAEFRAECARVAADMRKVHPDAGVTITPLFGVPPLQPETEGAAEALARRLTGDNGSHVVSYGTEGGQFQVRGYSAVVCGPGDIAQAHQPDEFLSVAQFQAGAAFLDRLLAELAD
jgi:acetylornithine deacetylase